MNKKPTTPSKRTQAALDAMKRSGINYEMGRGSRPEKKPGQKKPKR